MSNGAARSDSDEKRLDRLEERVNVYDGLIDKVLTGTIQSTQIFEASLVFIAIVAAGFALWSNHRLDQAIEDAEKKVGSALEQYTPESARFEPMPGRKDLKYNLYIEPGVAFGRQGFWLRATTNVLLSIEGKRPGRILGFQASNEGPFIEELKRVTGSDLYHEVPQIQFLGEGDGRLVPPDVPFASFFTFSTYFDDCEEAKAIARSATGRRGALTTKLTPVILNSSSQPETFRFQAVLEDQASSFLCPKG